MTDNSPMPFPEVEAIVAAEGTTPEEVLHRLKALAVRAELDLGEAFINAHRGELWHHPEARLYLHARLTLATVLERSGKTREALPHLLALLRFTKEDPQGARYHLARCHACLGDTKALQSLLRTFEADPSPVWTWMTLLAQHRTGQPKTAVKTLALARKQNPHIEGYLTGKVRLPKTTPQEGAVDSPETAMVAMTYLGPAWSADREAMYWLIKAAPKTADRVLPRPKA